MSMIDDGSERPIGTVSEDGELEVREYTNPEGAKNVGWCETELGQHQRWMRQAPDLYELYQDALRQLADREQPQAGDVAERWSVALERTGYRQHGLNGGVELLANEVLLCRANHSNARADR